MRHARFLPVLAAAALCWALEASAHPVSYENGTMLMSSYSPDRFENEVNYTFSPSSSFGVTQYRIDDDRRDRDYIIPRFAWRLRENELDHQANLYLAGGIGPRIDEGEERVTGLASVQADYETRRIYTLGMAETLVDGDDEPLTLLRYRAGVAPYKSGFDEIATWFIVQVDFKPYRGEDELSVTPLIRLFRKNVLLEVGVDLDGMPAVNAMYSF